MAWQPDTSREYTETELTPEEIEKGKASGWEPEREFFALLKDEDKVFRFRDGNNNRSVFGFIIRRQIGTVRDGTQIRISLNTGASMA